MVMFGLLDRDIDFIVKALKHFEEIDQAIIFGSRAIGNYKKGSDVDMAITGKKVTGKTISDLNILLNEDYPLPYFFDLLDYKTVGSEKLKVHIDTVGIEVYSRKDKR
ncbi:nucleotidyltransferase domain-containing protein [Lentibacillus sp. Marseille-P4043]|uniref:nucleotidyltransferase domain-containing protein n=1 Tax=Lentibacillus sp. Marseille-P4043 TaxID=2040293 RepID=UPI001F4567DB|nr:nucleotidyltransferase domain-containing protein [Lentibacillus sp. Marseille-P4043]